MYNKSNAMLEEAIEIAAKYHGRQERLDGSSYILHPIRVMLKMKTNAEKIIAILHDTIEDTALTLEDLRGRGFNYETVQAIKQLTKIDGQAYEDFIKSITDELAINVKIADIEDNLNDTCLLKEITDNHKDRLNNYLKALRVLKEKQRKNER